LVAAELLPDEEETNMALKITNREVEGVSVVTLDGRIVLGDESNALRVKLKSLIAEGRKQIVLNMDNIKYIDSAGLGILVAAHCSAKTRGASLRLCHLGSVPGDVEPLPGTQAHGRDRLPGLRNRALQDPIGGTCG